MTAEGPMAHIYVLRPGWPRQDNVASSGLITMQIEILVHQKVRDIFTKDMPYINILRPKQSGSYFADDISKYIF